MLDQIDLRLRQPGEHLLLGDFNLHHPTWSALERPASAHSEHLLRLLQRQEMTLHLPSGTKTLHQKKIQTTIDLVFGSSGLTNRLLCCSAADQLGTNSDHYPIATTYDLYLPAAPPVVRYSWKQMDVPALQKAFRPPPETPIHTTEDIDSQTSALVQAVTDAVNASTPRVTIHDRTHPGFDRECKELVRESRRLRRLAKDSNRASDSRLESLQESEEQGTSHHRAEAQGGLETVR